MTKLASVMSFILFIFPVALQVQAQILTLLSLLTWSQVMFYGHVRALLFLDDGQSMPIRSGTDVLHCVCARIGP